MVAALRRESSTVGENDASLVRQVQSGRVEAFGGLILRYQDRVHNTCRRICRHDEDAQDMTQEVFLKAFEAIGRFEGKSSFYTWLFRIAVNVSLSHRKKARLRLVRSLDDDGEGDHNAASTWLPDQRETQPAVSAERREACDLMAAALRAIDDQHRAVIVLRDIEACDYRQISEILDIPVGTVKSRVFRARVALRETYERLLPQSSGQSG